MIRKTEILIKKKEKGEGEELVSKINLDSFTNTNTKKIIKTKIKIKNMKKNNTKKNHKTIHSNVINSNLIHNKLNHNKFKIHKPKINKLKNHSRKRNHSRNIYLQKHKLKQNLSKNYISNLVNQYYNNDNIVDRFLEYKNTKQHIFPEHRRVIVIGDIHGDFDVAIKCLILAKCIKPIKVPQNKNVSSMDNFFRNLEWIGDDTYIVQLGDQIDRVRPQKWDINEVTEDSGYKDEGSTLEIFYLFYHLDNLAKKNKGRVFSIIGNHEIMNVEGDFRYVSLEEFKSFKEHLEIVYHRNSKFPYHSKTLKNNSYKLKNDENSSNHNNTDNTDNTDKYAKLPDGFRERLYAFSPTGLCANMIGYNYYTILQIGNWLFCHGSPVKNTLTKYSIDMINNYVSMYLIGMEDKGNKGDVDSYNITKHYNNITKHGDKSVLWNRHFGETEITDGLENSLSKQLDNILEEYNHTNSQLQNSIINSKKATHIAVGHTIQDTEKHGINSICNNRVWRCDVAMSKAFGDNKISKYRQPQVLEILNSITTNVLI